MATLVGRTGRSESPEEMTFVNLFTLQKSVSRRTPTLLIVLMRIHDSGYEPVRAEVARAYDEHLQQVEGSAREHQ